MQQLNITHKGTKGIYSIYEIEYNAKNEIQKKIIMNPKNDKAIITGIIFDYFFTSKKLILVDAKNCKKLSAGKFLIKFEREKL